MIRRLFLLLLAFVSFLPTKAQDIQETDTTLVRRKGLRISLLTCGPGYNEVYEVFGHTGIRVIDSNQQGDLHDIVYNYGMFNGYDANFEMKFMRGKLLYYVGVNLFTDFVEEYISVGRSVEEQVLQVDQNALREISEQLQTNALPQNMYYKYDFFFDNCATRVRDILQSAMGKGFVYGEARKQGYHPTFRDIINEYFYSKHWERVGVNILLGSKIDAVMSNMDIMFLPDYLRDGLAGATLNGKPVALPPQKLLPSVQETAAGTNMPMILTCSLLLLTILGLFVKKLQLLGRIISRLLLFVSGLLGCLIFVMWFATNHQGCSNNYNLLWAVPLNLYLAFAKPKGAGKYAVIAMILILGSLLVHILRVQGLIIELMPVLLSLLLIHGNIYRQSQKNAKAS